MQTRAPDAPPRRRRPGPGPGTARTQLGLLAFLAVVVGAGVLAGHLHHQRGTVATGPAGSGHELDGEVAATQNQCGAAPEGVTQGAPVSAVDDEGRVYASTSLGVAANAGDSTCVWGYRLQLPPLSSYHIQVADMPVVTVSAKALAQQHWTFTLHDGG
ncbi:MAG TPA: hypothetical protein VFH45_01825 [Acidimicrobiales bacterium]|nr:hypothetical protein [Acidimicrobiales bacterium]